MLDGLLCQRFAVGLAVLIAEPPKVLRDTYTRDFIHRNPLELREDDFQNVGVHRHSSGAVGAVPNAERNPHFIDECIEGVDRSGSGEFTRHSSGFLFLDVVLSYLFFPNTRHLPGFLASLCGSEVCGRIPSRTFEELAECVYAAKFITEKDAKRLVDVICDFVSEDQAKSMPCRF